MASSSSCRNKVAANFSSITLILLLFIFFTGCSGGTGNHPNSTAANTRSVPGFTTYRQTYANQAEIKDCPIQILFQTDSGLIDISPGMVPSNATSINTGIYYNPVWQKILPGLTDGDPNIASDTRAMVHLPDTGLMYQEIRSMTGNQTQVEGYAEVDNFSYKPYMSQVPDNEGYYYGILWTSHQRIPVQWPGITYIDYTWTPPEGSPYSYSSIIETRVDDQGVRYYRMGTRTNGVDNFTTDWIQISGTINFGFNAGYTPFHKGEYKFEYSINDSKVYEITWINRELVMSNAPQPIEFTVGDTVKFDGNSLLWDQGSNNLVPADNNTSIWEAVIYNENNEEIWRSNAEAGKDLDIQWDSGTLSSAAASRSLRSSDSKLKLVPLTGSKAVETSKTLSRSDNNSDGDQTMVLYYKLNARSISYPQSSIYDQLISNDIWYRISTEKVPMTGSEDDVIIEAYDEEGNLIASTEEPEETSKIFLPFPAYLAETITDDKFLKMVLLEPEKSKRVKFRVKNGPKDKAEIEILVFLSHTDQITKPISIKLKNEDPNIKGTVYSKEVTIGEDGDILIRSDLRKDNKPRTYSYLLGTYKGGNDQADFLEEGKTLIKDYLNKIVRDGWVELGVSAYKEYLTEIIKIYPDMTLINPSINAFKSGGYEKLTAVYPGQSVLKELNFYVQNQANEFFVHGHGLNSGKISIYTLDILGSEVNIKIDPGDPEDFWRWGKNLDIAYLLACGACDIGNFNKLPESKDPITKEKDENGGLKWLRRLPQEKNTVILGANYLIYQESFIEAFPDYVKYCNEDVPFLNDLNPELRNKINRRCIAWVYANSQVKRNSENKVDEYGYYITTYEEITADNACAIEYLPQSNLVNYYFIAFVRKPNTLTHKERQIVMITLRPDQVPLTDWHDYEDRDKNVLIKLEDKSAREYKTL